MRNRTTILILGAAQFVMVLDTTVMNVSISEVVADLDTTVPQVQLAITAYALVMAAIHADRGEARGHVGKATDLRHQAIRFQEDGVEVRMPGPGGGGRKLRVKSAMLHCLYVGGEAGLPRPEARTSGLSVGGAR